MNYRHFRWSCALLCSTVGAYHERLAELCRQTSQRQASTPEFRSPPEYWPSTSARPHAPTTAGVRRFLRQFLSDPRVVDFPRLPWWLILNLVILPIRSPRSAAAYRKIWTNDGSPLLIFSRRLADAIATRLPGNTKVELAMSYGTPSIDAGIESLRQPVSAVSSCCPCTLSIQARQLPQSSMPFREFWKDESGRLKRAT